MSAVIDDMINRGCWSPNESGYRALQNADEARALIGDRQMVFRGTSGYPNWVAMFRDSDVLLRWFVGGREWEQYTSYEKLFHRFKFADNSYPVGVPQELNSAHPPHRER